jgi:hypothetical protein
VGESLPLPTSLDVATARIARQKGTLTFDGEWNVSEYDRNLFSSQDDDDNMGNAGQFKIGVARDGDWRLGLSGQASVLEDRFQSFDRARPAYYYRDWNLEDVELVGRETTQEVALSAARARLGSVRLTSSRLHRDDYQGWKQEGVLVSGQLDDRGLSARVFESDVDGTDNVRTRRHLTAEAAYGVWKVVPGITYGSEDYLSAYTTQPDSGRAYQLVGAHLTSRGQARLSWRLDGERRDTRTIDPVTDEFADARRDDTVSGSLGYRSAGSTRAELQVIHRREDDLQNASESTTDLARLKAGSAWDAIGLRADADYEVSQADVATLQRSVVFVGEGQGDYNAIGEPVGKGKGSYMLVFLPTPDTTPVHTVGFNLRVGWKPSQRPHTATGFGGWILRNVSLDQTLGVSNSRRTNRRGGVPDAAVGAATRRHQRTTTPGKTGRCSTPQELVVDAALLARTRTTASGCTGAPKRRAWLSRALSAAHHRRGGRRKAAGRSSRAGRGVRRREVVRRWARASCSRRGPTSTSTCARPRSPTPNRAPSNDRSR